ncbi:hypothetical protein DFH27DRAFT_617569 [Peziza echinospora]|nr:hypothetical protein DFH27DRAFT_617569 [Peziza echinospora]
MAGRRREGKGVDKGQERRNDRKLRMGKGSDDGTEEQVHAINTLADRHGQQRHPPAPLTLRNYRPVRRTSWHNHPPMRAEWMSGSVVCRCIIPATTTHAAIHTTRILRVTTANTRSGGLAHQPHCIPAPPTASTTANGGAVGSISRVSSHLPGFGAPSTPIKISRTIVRHTDHHESLFIPKKCDPQSPDLQIDHQRKQSMKPLGGNQ